MNSCVEKSMKKMRNGTVPSGCEECEKDDGFFFGLSAFLLNLDVGVGYRIGHMISTFTVVMSNIEAQYILLAELLNTPKSYEGEYLHICCIVR